MRHTLFFGILGILLSCASPKDALVDLLPDSGFRDGWLRQDVAIHYLPETLYEYINGEAELYHSYGFNKLVTQSYVFQDDNELSFIVDIYDMGTPLMAFGLHSNYRHPSYVFAQIGTEAVVSEYDLRFVQGRYVIELKGADNLPQIREAMIAAARNIAGRIPDLAEFPDVLQLLPTEGQEPKTLRYASKEMLNQSFLPGGLEASYTVNGKTVLGFVVIFPDTVTAAQGLDALQTFHAENGDVDVTPEGAEETLFGVQTDYHGITLAAQEGRYLAGVQDFENVYEAGVLLNLIREAVRNADE